MPRTLWGNPPKPRRLNSVGHSKAVPKPRLLYPDPGGSALPRFRQRQNCLGETIARPRPFFQQLERLCVRRCGPVESPCRPTSAALLPMRWFPCSIALPPLPFFRDLWRLLHSLPWVHLWLDRFPFFLRILGLHWLPGLSCPDLAPCRVGRRKHLLLFHRPLISWPADFFSARQEWRQSSPPRRTDPIDQPSPRLGAV